MSQTPITVTYSLEEILKQINGKLDTLQKDVTDLKIGQVRLEEEVKTLKEDVKEIKMVQKTLVNDVADLKGAKSLIIPIVVAVTTSLLTLLIRSIPRF
jgi:archaellum component FlaC